VDEYATLDVVRTEAEAEIIRSLLEGAGITSINRPTNQAAGAFDGATFGVGPREILVSAGDLEAARAVLADQRSGT
jgi:Putative prokaryotic signal transducing protein